MRNHVGSVNIFELAEYKSLMLAMDRGDVLPTEPGSIPIGLIPRDKRLRVGFLTPVLLSGGAEEWHRILLNRLDPEKIAVTGLAVEDRDHVHASTSLHFHGKIPTGTGAIAIQRLLDTSEIIVDWGVDLRSYRVPAGVQVVGISHGDSQSPHARTVANLVSPSATHWVGVSPTAHIPDGFEATVIPNGADLDRLAPKRTRAEVRTQLGVGPGDKVILYVGRMATEDKRVDLLIDAMACLPDRFKLWLVGGGYETPKIMERAAQAIPGRFSHIPWTDSPGDFIHAADVGILLSRTESFGLVLAEFLHSGLPTLCTDVGLARMHPEFFRIIPVDSTAEEIALEMKAELLNLVRYERAESVGSTIEDLYGAKAFVSRWEDYLVSIAPPPPELPSAMTMAKNFASAVVTQIAAGNPVLTEAQTADRLKICEVCPQRIPGTWRCGGVTGCGCWLEQKAPLATARCPAGKWAEVGTSP